MAFLSRPLNCIVFCGVVAVSVQPTKSQAVRRGSEHRPATSWPIGPSLKYADVSENMALLSLN